MRLHTMALVRMKALESELICSYAGPGDDRETNKRIDSCEARRITEKWMLMDY